MVAMFRTHLGGSIFEASCTAQKLLDRVDEAFLHLLSPSNGKFREIEVWPNALNEEFEASAHRLWHL